MIIPPTWALPDAIRKRLGQSTYGRQRAVIEEGHILLVLHKPPSPEHDKREGVLFWRNAGGEWQNSKGGPGIGGLKRHIGEYAELEAQLTREYENTEDATGLFDIMERATPLARAARNMRQALQDAREAVEGDLQVIELRDFADDVDRNFDLLLQDLRNAVDFKIAKEAESQARLTKETLKANHRLNILAALFFPLTAVSSLFGMNFSNGLDQSNPMLFWVILGAGLVLGFGIKSWVLAQGRED